MLDMYQYVAKYQYRFASPKQVATVVRICKMNHHGDPLDSLSFHVYSSNLNLLIRRTETTKHRIDHIFNIFLDQNELKITISLLTKPNYTKTSKRLDAVSF